MADLAALGALQAYAMGRSMTLPTTARKLLAELRTILWKAANRRKILDSPRFIEDNVKLIAPPQEINDQLKQQQLDKGASCIVFGDQKNQARNRNLPHIKRNDGAWFDFTITVREVKEGLELLAYDFEIRLPPALGAPFLRFDLNLPGHANEVRELRCHLHPGFDDVLVPAPLMTPTELLVVIVEHLRPTRNTPRSPTRFEVDWFRETFVEARIRAQ